MTNNIAMILSQDPELYGQFLEDNHLHARFFDSVFGLNRALVQDHALQVLVLEVRMVMEARPEERDRLFALSKGLPVVRAARDEAGQAVHLLDQLACEDHEGVCRPVRSEERVRVRLEAMLSDFRDPFLAEPREAVVLDLSPRGCFVHTPYGQPDEDYLYLKIMEIGSNLPIHCAVRWRRPQPGGGLPSGLGLKFIEINPDQCDEILSRIHNK